MKTKTFFKHAGGLLTVSLLCVSAPLTSMADEATQFLTNWALNLPGGGAGWLGVERQTDGSLKSSMLWGGGSPFTLNETKLRQNTLVMTRQKKDKKTKKITIELFEAVVEGPFIKIERKLIDDQGKIKHQDKFNGNRIPKHGPAPDLSKLKFGKPIPLMNGKDMTGWKVMNKKAPNCWSIKDGILSNRVMGPDGKSKHGTNIKTEKLFNDFKLTTEVRVPKHGNSGIYLRGIYEIQVAESFGKPKDCHHMGALYGRITPVVSAEKPANEWQTYEITLCDRYVTVILNGKTIIDNQPAMGCTGGALTSDEFRAGPLYLQGDHTNVDYRNMVLTPIIKK
ncbi:MAG: DUF1080 domain-containing protein [Kiritimatiellae bacterium]|jgi:hypothetical protein|nr:DUF1080 domain-containing protein [Kiritimatiellia bacterium]